MTHAGDDTCWPDARYSRKPMTSTGPQIRLLALLKVYVGFDPVEVSFFCSKAVSIQPHETRDLVQKRTFTHGSTPLEITVCINSIIKSKIKSMLVSPEKLRIFSVAVSVTL
jgi:hypothetical protein